MESVEGKIFGSRLVWKPKDRWIHEVTSKARKMLGITRHKRLALEGKMYVRRLMPQIIIIFFFFFILVVVFVAVLVVVTVGAPASKPVSISTVISYQPDHTVLISRSPIPTHCSKTPLGAATLQHASANDQQLLIVEITT
jgi:hypothetical protein